MDHNGHDGKSCSPARHCTTNRNSRVTAGLGQDIGRRDHVCHQIERRSTNARYGYVSSPATTSESVTLIEDVASAERINREAYDRMAKQGHVLATPVKPEEPVLEELEPQIVETEPKKAEPSAPVKHKKALTLPVGGGAVREEEFEVDSEVAKDTDATDEDGHTDAVPINQDGDSHTAPQAPDDLENDSPQPSNRDESGRDPSSEE